MSKYFWPIKNLKNISWSINMQQKYIYMTQKPSASNHFQIFSVWRVNNALGLKS